MVIANSDSNTTLVSLDQYNNGLKFAVTSAGDATLFCDAGNFEHRNLCRTELLVDDCSDDSISDCDWLEDARSSCSLDSTKTKPLYLPEDGQHVDAILKHNASLRESCEELLCAEPRFFTNKNTTSRLIYVAQGERANATVAECDLLVSDKATTCHILAFRSTCSFDNNKDSDEKRSLPLTSLTHIDGASYDECVRRMIQDHVTHHSCSGHRTGSTDSNVTIEIHIMGGFNDQDSTSSSITDWLVGLLADIAWEYKHPVASSLASSMSVNMVLKTCAVTSMNDTGYSCPIGRGMSIDVRTGQVSLAQCHGSAMGPVPVLRSVRLWSKTKGCKPRLNVIHSVTDNLAPAGQIVVQPFHFAPFSEMKALLALPDDVLLQYTSTSPDVEEEGFCHSVRASMKFLLQHQCHKIFGQFLDQPLFFSRVGVTGNDWKQVA
jgi:Protein N-terminal asparagine amidohydrolase